MTETSDGYETIDDLNEREDVHGILVQLPVPDHVDKRRVQADRPVKDVDGFHPENVGRLVAGDARFKPCTPHGVQKLLAAYDVETEGAGAVVVGRSDIVREADGEPPDPEGPIGKRGHDRLPLADEDLEGKLATADIVIAAVGVPEFIDGSMLKGRRDRDRQWGLTGSTRTPRRYALVGDVEYESAKEAAGAITPVPGGVGPMTRAMLLYNTVKAAGLQSDVALDLD